MIAAPTKNTAPMRNSRKLRLDLFDRRYKVFDGSQLFEFSAATLAVEFLFDADVVGFLDEMKKQALNLRLTQKRLESLPSRR